MPRVGVAGWNLPREIKERFGSEGTHLQRYARQFNCVEINSSFYREHRPETYVRWANEVPENFRFSVKLLKYFTHEKKLSETGAALKNILGGPSGLGEKWAVLLVQLPPKLEFDEKTAAAFFKAIRRSCKRLVFCEPRNDTWASKAAVDLLGDFAIGKVSADPERCPWKQMPLDFADIYFRLHGSPKIYESSYETEALVKIKSTIKSVRGEAWCIFDNTKYGTAFKNALELRDL